MADQQGSDNQKLSHSQTHFIGESVTPNKPNYSEIKVATGEIGEIRTTIKIPRPSLISWILRDCAREERGLCREETVGSADNGVGGVDGRWVISCGDGRERERAERICHVGES